jgi:hypothetical protein
MINLYQHCPLLFREKDSVQCVPVYCTEKTQCRKFETNIPRKGIARPQSKVTHTVRVYVSVSDLHFSTI